MKSLRSAMEHPTNPLAKNIAVRCNAFGRKAAGWSSAIVLVGVLAIGCSPPRSVIDGPPPPVATPPKPQEHVVRDGDTFDSIAGLYGVSAFAIKYHNKVCRLSAGQRLIIKNLRGRKEAPKDKLEWPADGGRLTSEFGDFRSGGRRHKGIDIAAPLGTPIYAAAPGCVDKISFDRPGYGLYIIIEHMGNQSTLYAHLANRSVHKDQFVENGQQLAEMGQTGNATGSHLHFEVSVDGKPRDPLAYLAVDSDLRVERRKNNQPSAQTVEEGGGGDVVGFARSWEAFSVGAWRVGVLTDTFRAWTRGDPGSPACRRGSPVKHAVTPAEAGPQKVFVAQRLRIPACVVRKKPCSQTAG